MIENLPADGRAVARYWAKVSKPDDDGCWLWLAATDASGYGRFHFGGKLYAAHRASVILDGRDIAPGLVVDHICRVRNCVNPNHLRTATVQENLMADGSEAAAKALSEQEKCGRGHPFDEINTRITSAGRRQCRQCVRDYRAKQYRAQRERGLYRGRPLAEKPWAKWAK